MDFRGLATRKRRIPVAFLHGILVDFIPRCNRDSQIKTARTNNKQNRKARPGLPKQDSQNRIASLGQLEQDFQNRTTRTGQPEQDCQCRQRTGGHDNQNMAAVCKCQYQPGSRLGQSHFPTLPAGWGTPMSHWHTGGGDLRVKILKK